MQEYSTVEPSLVPCTSLRPLSGSPGSPQFAGAAFRLIIIDWKKCILCICMPTVSWVLPDSNLLLFCKCVMWGEPFFYYLRWCFFPFYFFMKPRKYVYLVLHLRQVGHTPDQWPSLPHTSCWLPIKSNPSSHWNVMESPSLVPSILLLPFGILPKSVHSTTPTEQQHLCKAKTVN